jgi:hypothetical protein
VEPKDIKRCEKIAQLLVEGKKGHDLENAIQEFDKYHVPEVVTRFEAPITARSYRRSSSAPIPDTENTRAQNSFLQTISDLPKRKPRAASTRCPSPATVHDSPSPTDSIIEQLEQLEQQQQQQHQQSLPLKEEAQFVSASDSFAFSYSRHQQHFDNFSFNNLASPLSAYDCDPIAGLDPMPSFDQGQFHHPPLTVDTDFMPLPSWSPSPSPITPATPNYMLGSGSDPAFVDFDSLDHVSLQKSFEDFSATFPPLVDQQPCTISQTQDHRGAGAGNLFHFDQQPMLADLSEFYLM